MKLSKVIWGDNNIGSAGIWGDLEGYGAHGTHGARDAPAILPPISPPCAPWPHGVSWAPYPPIFPIRPTHSRVAFVVTSNEGSGRISNHIKQCKNNV